ncbi:MAG: HAMP domain-containing histidine kinase [Synechococcaceae cyanobacterium RM1_1_27]|nr:HAMP domain-containing histidine kinase [Synechococcaceae cyanobacterium RM1_1_27]
MVSVERLNRYIGMLESECRREINLVEDLLNLQRLASKPDPVNLDEIDLNAVLQRCAQTFAIRAHEYQVKLRYTAEAQLPTVRTEATGLDRILQELLNNACKYTQPGGEIVISATPLTQQAIPGIQISIGNTAEIPAQELPRIFDKFYRVPKGDPWQRGGTGLGLSLVKALVEALHGQIAVTSAAEWTVFEIWLPLQSPLTSGEGS